MKKSEDTTKSTSIRLRTTGSCCSPQNTTSRVQRFSSTKTTRTQRPKFKMTTPFSNYEQNQNFLVGHVYFDQKLSSLAITEIGEEEGYRTKIKKSLVGIDWENWLCFKLQWEENKANQQSHCCLPKLFVQSPSRHIQLKEPGHLKTKHFLNEDWVIYSLSKR